MTFDDIVKETEHRQRVSCWTLQYVQVVPWPGKTNTFMCLEKQSAPFNSLAPGENPPIETQITVTDTPPIDPKTLEAVIDEHMTVFLSLRK